MPDDIRPIFSQLDDLRDRQFQSWQRGERLLVEMLIAGITPALADRELLELIYAEVILRAELGENCAADEYVQRFPQFAGQLQRLFALHQALESPRSDQPPANRPQPSPVARNSDRNLLFGILALQMDFIGRDALVDALRDWTTQKDKPLGQILVERGDLSTARRDLLEPLVEEHVRRHDGDPAVSLASISSVIEGTVDWRRVHDVDIAESLAARRLTRNTKPASVTGAGTSAANAGRFRVLRPHAEGGLGIVCVAQDEELHREVALKEIKPQFAKDIASRNRFTLEAEITGGLEHPGIVPVYGLGQYSDGRPYYAMRFIRGDSLKDAIERFHSGPRKTVASAPSDVNAATVIGHAPHALVMANVEASSHPASRQQFESVNFRKLLGRFIDVCQAIEYAHSRGVLHRDLKPGNIMLGKYGETLVVDWGLAKAAGKDERFANVEEATLVPSSGSSIEQTVDGSVIGTPAYMSPEQAAGGLDQLGPATDVYSLGATLYHVLTGRSPFAKLPLPELLQRVQSGKFPRPREVSSHIPKSLESICLKAMALSPSDRYQSATAIAEDIEHWLADEPVNACRETIVAQAARWSRRHRAWAMSGTAALAVVAVVATVAAVWINGQKGIIAEQEHAATKLAERNAALANDKSQLAEQKTKLAEQEKSAREKAKLATVAERLAKEEEAKQRMLAIAALRYQNISRYALDLREVQGMIQSRNLEMAQRILVEVSPEDRGWEWGFLARQCGLESAVMALIQSTESKSPIRQNPIASENPRRLAGHSAPVQAVAFSPDQTLLASAGGDGQICLWRTSDWTLQRQLIGHTQAVRTLTFIPGQGHLASAGFDRAVRVWDVVTGREIRQLSMGALVFFSLASSQDGHFLYAGGGLPDGATTTLKNAVDYLRWGGKAVCWNISNGYSIEYVLDEHTGIVRAISISPDGTRLVTAGYDSKLLVWNAPTGKLIYQLEGHQQPIFGAEFNPAGSILCSVAGPLTAPRGFAVDEPRFSGGVRVWDVAAGREVAHQKVHEATIYAVTFTADGRRLLTGSADHTLRTWDVETRQNLLTIPGNQGEILSVASAFDGNIVATGGKNGTVFIWDGRLPKEVKYFGNVATPAPKSD